MMKRVLAALTFVACLVPAASAEGQRFTFVSDNPSGAGKHGGSVEVTPTANANIYDVVWTVPEGSLKGIASVDEATDTVTAAYVQDGQPGLVILKEQADRSWAGSWYQAGKTGAEAWTPAP